MFLKTSKMSWNTVIENKIKTLEEASVLIKKWQKAGMKIVFTNGCFDIIHKGHIDYLAAAASLGGKMIIGLNTDDSVRKLKGNGRPVNDEKARSLMLAALHFTDMIVLFDEDTPYNLIKQIQPDILVKGKDYKAEDIVGYDVVTKRGGEVITIELTDGYSTTALIERIKNSY